MLGVLSTLPPFDVVPEAVWLQALKGISRKPALWDLNHAAFMAGRGMQKVDREEKDVGEGPPSPPPSFLKTLNLSNPSCRFPDDRDEEKQTRE